MVVYFDDILVYILTMSELVENLSRVMDALTKETLYAKFKKVFFGRESLDFLGFVVTSQGVPIDEAKLRAIRD